MVRPVRLVGGRGYCPFVPAGDRLWHGLLARGWHVRSWTGRTSPRVMCAGAPADAGASSAASRPSASGLKGRRLTRFVVCAGGFVCGPLVSLGLGGRGWGDWPRTLLTCPNEKAVGHGSGMAL